MNKVCKICSIIVIVIASLAILSFIYLCIIGEFKARWIITALFSVFLIITNAIDLRNGGKNGQ